MSNKIILWGGTGKAMLALELFKIKNAVIFDPFLKEPNFKTKLVFINKINDLKKQLNSFSKFFVCIGGSHGYIRSLIAKKLIKKKLQPISLIHNKSMIAPSVKIGKMCMIMPGSIINSNTSINDFCVINTAAVIEHDNIIEEGVTIMSSASISGNCHIMKNTTIGTNATIFPNLKIEENVFIGSGSVLTKDVKKNNILIGSPAKFLKKNQYKENHIIHETIDILNQI